MMQELFGQLVTEFRAAAPKVQQSLDSAAVFSIETEWESPPDPLQWLQDYDTNVRMYWSSTGSNVAVAGIGAADIVRCAPHSFAEARGRVAQRLRLAEHAAAYFGGIRFDPQAAQADYWRDFGAACFVLPRLTLRRRAATSVLALHVLLHAESRVAALAEELCEWYAASFCPRPPGVQAEAGAYRRSDIPAQPGWTAAINSALAQFADGAAQKIVLARRSQLDYATAAPDALRVLAKLRLMNPDAFHFAFQFARGACFIGATPERLYRREGRQLWTESLAGTRRRGRNPAEDEALGLDLLHSDKDRREHYVVRERISAALGELCANIVPPAEPELRKQARVQHLYSPLRAHLKAGVGDAALIESLHPTPAVGGEPRHAAMEAIRRLEHFDRGWYAGPVGMLAGDAAEFAVAIRSGLQCGNTWHLFSGAGIVAGSDPAEEWREIENKMQVFLEALGADTAQ